MKGIYKYTDLMTGEVVYVGKDSHIDKNSRHKDHLSPSRYDDQPFNRIIQNNPERYEYGVIWASEDCTTLKLNKMEILFGKIYNPKFNFDKFGKGGCNGHTEETKQKISESFKGENNPMYGKTHSDKSRKKMSENHPDVSGENNPMYGKTRSEETKNKIGESVSKSKNTSGYLNVYKNKTKNCKQGFIWRYTYYKDSKQKSISSVDLGKLEQKVKEKGLKWERIENG